jgi:hypothetical protein
MAYSMMVTVRPFCLCFWLCAQRRSKCMIGWD